MMNVRAYKGIALLAALVVTASCGNGEAQETEAEAAAETAAQPAAEQAAGSNRVINVQVLELQPQQFTDFVSLTGNLEASRDVVLAAEESGVVRQVFAEKGSAVRAGQPIVKIDDTVLRAQHDQARSEATLAKETYERQRRLWEEEKIGSEIAYLRAKYGAETAEANARVLAARLERTVVRAPIDGVLDDRTVEVGSMVTPGAPVGRIVDVNPLEVNAGVPERYASDIRRGAQARVVIDNMPQTFEGRATFVGAAINAQNRTFPVEFAIANPGGVLKPGMVARIELEKRTAETAMLVPRDAVLRSANGYRVYVVVGEGEQLYAEARPVEMGAGSGAQVVITGGVQAGDRVVVLGQQQLANGDAVRIVTGGGSQ